MNNWEEIGRQNESAVKKWKVIMVEAILEVFRFENIDSKAKMGWNLGLLEAMVQIHVEWVLWVWKQGKVADG